MAISTQRLVQVQVLLEAEEEIGSASLPGLLRKKKGLLRADLAVSCDGGQISEDQGGIPISMRGRVSLDLEAQTLAHDVHSGMRHPHKKRNQCDPFLHHQLCWTARGNWPYVMGCHHGLQPFAKDSAHAQNVRTGLGSPGRLRRCVAYRKQEKSAFSLACLTGFLGGSAQNALHSLVDMLASMRAPDGTILVEGFHE